MPTPRPGSEPGAGGAGPAAPPASPHDDTPDGALLIRDARDDDAAGLIGLIGGCFAEYPGCVLDVDGEAPELRAIASDFAARGGRFWVAQRDGAVVGSVGTAPSAESAAPRSPAPRDEAPRSPEMELFKLYVARPARRGGLGARLVGLVEAEARRRGARRLVLWSDTRFADAHRLYERLGFVRRPGSRALHDRSASVEFGFAKDLGRKDRP